MEQQQSSELRDFLVKNDFTVCENKVNKARVGCYCDYCVLVRQDIDVNQFLGKVEQ